MDDTFIKIAKALNLVPCDFYRKHKLLHYLHLFITFALTLLEVLYICYFTVVIDVKQLAAVIVFNAVGAILLGIFVVNTIFRNILMQANKFDEMLEHFKTYDALLPENYRRHSRQYTKIYALLYYGVYFMFGGSVVYGESDLIVVIVNIVNLIIYVYLLGMQSVVWSVLGTLRNQIRNLNCCMETITKSKQLDNVHVCTKLVLLNAKIVPIFNEIFGFSIFILLINAMLQLLMVLKLFLVGLAFNQYLILSLCLYMTAPVVWMIKLSHEISNDGRTTTRLAYEVLAHAQNNAEFGYLQDFVRQTEVLCPVLSAHGFCNLDYNLLFQMLQLIINYVVVVVQMK